MSGGRQWKRERITLEEAMRRARLVWASKPDPRYTFDPTIRPNAVVIKGASHDGTLMLSMDLMNSAIAPLLGQVELTGNPPREDEEVTVTFGQISIATVYGRVMVNGNRFLGMRERVRVPVLVEYRKRAQS